MKKLNEKYQLSEIDRQKATSDHNNLFSEMQQNEKKNQILLKEREISFLEEKNIFLRKSEQQNRTI